MESHKKLRQKQINSASSLLRKHSQYLKYLQNKYLITVVGLCGSGKSTIINHIIGNHLKIKKINGITQVVLKTEMETIQQQNNQFPKIGIDFTKSCTDYPTLYEVKDYENLVICDTKGYYPGRQTYSGCDILHQLYLNAAKAVVSIVFVISKGDIDSKRGGGMHYMFQQFDRFPNFDSMKYHIQFVINYKNIELQQVDQLYEQLVEFDKQIIEMYVSKKQYISELQTRKVKFFECIFGKDHYTDQSKFQNFQKRVLLIDKSQLTNHKSQFKQSFFQMIYTKIQNKNYFKFIFSSQIKSFATYLIKDIQLFKSRLETCSKKSDIYYKTKLIQKTLWQFLKSQTQIKTTKQQFLTNLLLRTTNDVQESQNTINYITEKLKTLDEMKDEITLDDYFIPKQQNISQLPYLNVTMKTDHEILTVIKKIQGFQIIQQSLNKQKMLYEVKMKPIEAIKKKVDIKVFTRQQFVDKDLKLILISTKDRLQKKIKSFSLLDSPQFQSELQSILKLFKNKAQVSNNISKFIKNYSMSKQEMINSIPKIDELKVMYNQIQILPYLNSSTSFVQQIINSGCLLEFKAIKFLNLQDKKKGYCCYDFHLIEQPVYLQCGHCYQRYCYTKLYQSKKSKKCIACNLLCDQLNLQLVQLKQMKQKTLTSQEYDFLKQQNQRIFNINSRTEPFIST